MSKEHVHEFYEARAKSLIKQLRERRGLTYKELAERLARYGLDINDRALINRINRGAFTFDFALMVLAALGQKSIDIPTLSEAEAEAKPRRQGPARG